MDDNAGIRNNIKIDKIKSRMIMLSNILDQSINIIDMGADTNNKYKITNRIEKSLFIRVSNKRFISILKCRTSNNESAKYTIADLIIYDDKEMDFFKALDLKYLLINIFEEYTPFITDAEIENLFNDLGTDEVEIDAGDSYALTTYRKTLNYTFDIYYINKTNNIFTPIILAECMSFICPEGYSHIDRSSQFAGDLNVSNTPGFNDNLKFQTNDSNMVELLKTYISEDQNITEDGEEVLDNINNEIVDYIYDRVNNTSKALNSILRKDG